MKKQFALIGAAGFVAPRHMAAIKYVGGDLVAACDPRDSVGVIDSHFPEAKFFTEFERFDRHLDRMRRKNDRIDYVSICSPNYLHDAHARFAMRSDADAICEKPLVLNPWNIDGLARMQEDTGRKVFSILQLRLHDTIQALREKVALTPDHRYAVDLSYIASRGPWYHESWKGNESRSGGVSTNIGVHFFDMLLFVFGRVRASEAHLRDNWRAAGYLDCERADVRWFLSVDSRDLPKGLDGSKRSFRSIVMDGEEIEFSEGFTELHNRSYQEILVGRGFSLDDVRPSIEIVSGFRGLVPRTAGDRIHPLSRAHIA